MTKDITARKTPRNLTSDEEQAYRRLFEYDPDFPGWARLREYGGVIAYPSRLRIVESYTTYGAYTEPLKPE